MATALVEVAADEQSLRERMETTAFDVACRVYSGVVGALPSARPETYGIEVVRDVAYVENAGEDQRLDVYRPADGAGIPLLYVHGGGFSRLSRQVYWIAALSLARRGFTVFIVDHRRAPQRRYPAAHEDVARAALWVRDNAARFGCDPSRLVLAGDSSGGNLVTALALACSYRSVEPWARHVFDAKLAVKAVATTCGFLEVLDTSRYTKRDDVEEWVKRSIAKVGRDYAASRQVRGTLMDPLLVLERGGKPERPLPPFFVGCGDLDPLAEDSARLVFALKKIGVRVEERVYEGGVHGLHYLFPWQRRSIRCWSGQARFLRRCATELA